MTVTDSGSPFFFGTNGAGETGGPIFSAEPQRQGATFYACDTVTGFPPGGGRGINRPGGSSFIALKHEPDGGCKTWICASAGAYLNGSYWEYQIRYFSGDLKTNLPEKMEIGIVPGSGNFSSPQTVSNFAVELDEGTLKVVALEVTQVVQDLENSVPLIAGKRTLVRAFLEPRAPEQITVRSTDVKLRGFKRTTAGDFLDLGYAFATRPRDRRQAGYSRPPSHS